MTTGVRGTPGCGGTVSSKCPRERKERPPGVKSSSRPAGASMTDSRRGQSGHFEPSSKKRHQADGDLAAEAGVHVGPALPPPLVVVAVVVQQVAFLPKTQ